MAFMSILLMILLLTIVSIVALIILSLGGATLLTVGIVFLRRNKKAGNRIVAPVISIVLGAIMLLPVLISVLWYLYALVVGSGLRPDDAAAILQSWRIQR